MTKLPSAFAVIWPALFLLALAILSLKVNSEFSPAERSALLSLKQQWNNPPPLQNWNTTSSPCEWPEIRCDGNSSVTAIILRDKNITGPVPPSICDLKNLQVISLGYNYITGVFPTALYNCTNLLELDLAQNLLVGELPIDIDRIRTLRYVDLSGNNLTGNIPPAFGRLPELSKLYLFSNLFNGTFPSEIGNLSSLLVLDTAYNPFSSMSIPIEFGNLTQLEYLWMTENNLIGEIPESFSNLASLQHLDFSSNNLAGNIPPGLFLLKNLSNVLLYKNRLSGTIPSTIGSVNLTQIDLSMNMLIGKIPEDFGKLQQLEVLHLFSNQLFGEIPPRIALIPTLTSFMIFKNNFRGELPNDFGLHSNLEYFDVSNNNFTGNLPGNLCHGRNLSSMVAFSNHLAGGIPPSLASCNTLRTIQLYSNNFSGEVPPGIWTLPNLISLMISGNSFSGELPSAVAWNLSRVEISENKFSGRIPAGVSSWSRLLVLEASNNQLIGEIPSEITSLSYLTTLLLDGNSFSGELPSEIASWKSLTMLNLGRNKLSGQIPPAIGSLPDLIYLDLSENQLSGQIPPQLGHLRLSFLNLSSNQLMGKIPFEFDNMADESSFGNNPNLCSTSRTSQLRSCNSKSDSPRKLSRKLFATVLVLSFVVFLTATFFTFFIIRECRKKKPVRNTPRWKLTSFHKLEFTEAGILASLTENNLIGSGGSGKVYRIAVGRGNKHVAVKKFWNAKKLDETLEKDFLSEIQILASVRHSNIVKLMCYVSSEYSNLIVYEYMENQSLDKWLHREKRKSATLGGPFYALDWPTRLKIAIGAAQGLCYMHHFCSPPILHRDVKSSNILLDSEFNARIADFGLAKILAKDKPGEANTMSAIAGSFGYIAPECAYATKVSEKIDVYSFGVVLLEIVTGREPNKGDDDMSLAEWAWMCCGYGDSIATMLDEEFVESSQYIEGITAVYKLGLVCTSTLPCSRPSMKEVLEILRRCRPAEADDEKEFGSVSRVEYDAAPLLGEQESYLSSYRSAKNVSNGNDDGNTSRV